MRHECLINTNWKRSPTQERGIICGVDYNQEWLLPWWWERYSFENQLPVLFCDFGMSKEANAWCKQRGEVVPILTTPGQIKSRTEIPSPLQTKWNQWKINWASRSAWFKKPLAFLESPYQISIWLDLDCEVLSPLDKLFSYCSPDIPIAMSLVEADGFKQTYPFSFIYNGGVVVFRHGLNLISECANYALTKNHEFFAEDILLSYLIEQTKTPVAPLPIEWNWEPRYGINLYAHIFHWIRHSKELLKTQGGIKPLRDQFEQKALTALPPKNIIGSGSK